MTEAADDLNVKAALRSQLSSPRRKLGKLALSNRATSSIYENRWRVLGNPAPPSGRAGHVSGAWSAGPPAHRLNDRNSTSVIADQS